MRNLLVLFPDWFKTSVGRLSLMMQVLLQLPSQLLLLVRCEWILGQEQARIGDHNSIRNVFFKYDNDCNRRSGKILE